MTALQSPTLTLEIVAADDPRFATCGAKSPGGRMTCEYPPDHQIGEAGYSPHHFGRDRRGAWRSWPMAEGAGT